MECFNASQESRRGAPRHSSTPWSYPNCAQGGAQTPLLVLRPIHVHAPSHKHRSRWVEEVAERGPQPAGGRFPSSTGNGGRALAPGGADRLDADASCLLLALAMTQFLQDHLCYVCAPANFDSNTKTWKVLVTQDSLQVHLSHAHAHAHALKRMTAGGRPTTNYRKTLRIREERDGTTAQD